MQVIAHKQTLLFINPEGGEDVKLTPQPFLQEVPDWVRETLTYQYAAKAKLVTEMNVVEPPGKDKKDKSEKEKEADDKDKEKEPADKSKEPAPTHESHPPATHSTAAHHTPPPPEPEKGKTPPPKK